MENPHLLKNVLKRHHITLTHGTAPVTVAHPFNDTGTAVLEMLAGLDQHVLLPGITNGARTRILNALHDSRRRRPEPRHILVVRGSDDNVTRCNRGWFRCWCRVFRALFCNALVQHNPG